MLKEFIVSHLKKDIEVKSPKDFRLNPSTLNKCRRAVWYQYHISPSDDLTDCNLVKMAMGDNVHLFVQKTLNELEVENVLKVVEMEVDKVVRLPGADFDIRYRIDAVVEFVGSGEKYVVEIKSTYSKGFDRVSMEADENHLVQLKTYMSLENIKNGVLIYIARDNGLIIEHVVNMSDDEINRFREELVQKGNELKNIVLSENLPDRDFNLVVEKKENVLNFSKSDWQCRYCVYRSACFENKSKR